MRRITTGPIMFKESFEVQGLWRRQMGSFWGLNPPPLYSKRGTRAKNSCRKGCFMHMHNKHHQSSPSSSPPPLLKCGDVKKFMQKLMFNAFWISFSKKLSVIPLNIVHHTSQKPSPPVPRKSFMQVSFYVFLKL